MSDRQRLLQASWDQIAKQYRDVLAPRFLPWIQDTVDAFIAASPPEKGEVFVPACGPGEELALLAGRMAGHSFVGVDLSQGMLDLAEALAAERGLSGRVRVVAGDASRPLPGLAPLAGVFSTFGLQQMPEQAQALASWARALQPGGVLAVCFWGARVEESGPWRQLADLSAPAQPPPDWEAGLLGPALAEGAEVVLDAAPSHTMRWPSLGAFWQGMTEAGPWHARRLLRGEEHMEQLRRELFALYADPDAPLEHRPRARLLVLRRKPPAGPANL